MPIEQLETGAGAEITHEEWVQRLYPGQMYQTQKYVKTVTAAAHLMWEGRLLGEYGSVCESLKLGNFYWVAEHTYSQAPIEDVVRAGLEAFREAELKPLTRMMVRILNSQSRFAEALDLLETSEAWSNEILQTRDRITPAFIFQCEAMLARIGCNMLDDGVYIDAMETPPRLPGLNWRWLSEILTKEARSKDVEQPHLLEHVQAIAAQMRFMRGPYVPRAR